MGKRILLIDDEPDLVQVVMFRLRAKGYDVMTASDGVEGLEKLKTYRPDLIILDLNLPRMSGLEFYGRITAVDGRSLYPVLVLTSRQDLETVFKEIDVDGFLTKPFEANELIAEVQRIMNEGRDPAVFLVDLTDNPRVQEITGYLRSQRYGVTVVEDLAALRENIKQVMPDYIIMEYMQRDMSGEDLIREIRKNAALKDVPVIVYSYSGFPQFEKKSLNAGADKYICKPVDYSDLAKAIKEINAKKRRTG